MKIEMGESLFYSWLRHVKECQVVQTNWKVSTQWQIHHEQELKDFMQMTDSYFYNKYHYQIYKNNKSLSQLLQQGECDVVGIRIKDNVPSYYAVDVAFHENGLNYGLRAETVMKVVAKSLRTAMCLYGFMDTKKANIYFASPKIGITLLKDIEECINDINQILHNKGFDFTFKIIANNDFNEKVMQPILQKSGNIADTSELFLRSYQMYKMFSNERKQELAPPIQKPIVTNQNHNSLSNKTASVVTTRFDEPAKLKEMKVGQLANVVLRKMLSQGCASADEIKLMQDAAYSKNTFGINYPLLFKTNSYEKKLRYYANPVYINNERYLLCSEWYETSSNNDRPYLTKWIIMHS